jgi:hypothetical protein
MTEPHVYDYEAASTRLGGVASAEWLQKHKTELPHCQFGTRVGFTEADLAEIAEMHRVRPGQKAPSVEQHKPLSAPVPQQLRDLKPRRAGKKSA